MLEPGKKSRTRRTSAERGFGAIAIFDVLRDEILALDLAPGQLIDEASLAERFDVSRSPVREALVRLGSEGLVNTVPNKGTVVAGLNMEELPQYIDALDLVQRAVTRLAAQYRTEADILRIKAAQERFLATSEKEDFLGMIEANRDFHLEIAIAGRNRYLTEIYRRLLDQGRRNMRVYFRAYADKPPPALHDTHYQMIDAIEKRDCDRAERLARQHADEKHRRFIHLMSQRRTRDIAAS